MRRKRPGCGVLCGGSCLGALVLFAVVFSVLFSRAGTYRPNIPPPKRLPNPNAFDAYRAAGEMVAANGGTRSAYPANAQGSGIDLNGARALLAQNRQALQMVRAAFPLDCRVPPGRDVNAMFPYLGPMRDLARLFHAESQVKAEAGDHGGAFSSSLDALELGGDVSRGGLLIHALVGIAVQAIAHSGMIPEIERLPAARSPALKARLMRILETEVSAGEILAEERNSALTIVSTLDDLTALTGSSPGGNAGGGIAQAAGRIRIRFLRDGALKEIEEFYRVAIGELGKPAYRRRTLPEPKNPIAGILLPVFGLASAKIEEMQARNRLILSVLAVTEYRKTYQELPQTLATVKLPARLITDPFSHRPLIYRPLGNSFLLYSVGRDGNDDGGVPADENQSRPIGDIGIRPFRSLRPGASRASPQYRKVPYMKPPKLPAGAPPLNP